MKSRFFLAALVFFYLFLRVSLMSDVLYTEIYSVYVQTLPTEQATPVFFAES